MEVHKTLGNGFREVIYPRALEIEMAQQGLTASREYEIDIFYKGIKIGQRRADFFVEGKVMVELKAVIQLEDVHLAQAINYKMPPEKVSALFGNLRFFCNKTGLGDPAHPRADFIKGENLDSPLPQLDKVRTCALSVMTGFVQGNNLVIEMMNGSRPPPLKPGCVLPEKIEDIDIDIYEFTPRTHRHLFFAINKSRRGGRKTTPFDDGAIYDWTLDGREYAWMPHVKPARITVRYPLSQLNRLRPKSEIPSPYKP